MRLKLCQFYKVYLHVAFRNNMSREVLYPISKQVEISWEKVKTRCFNNFSMAGYRTKRFSCLSYYISNEQETKQKSGPNFMLSMITFPNAVPQSDFFDVFWWTNEFEIPLPTTPLTYYSHWKDPGKDDSFVKLPPKNTMEYRHGQFIKNYFIYF